MSPPRHAAPRPRPAGWWKRRIARVVPFVAAVAVVMPIWEQISDEDTPPHLLAAKTALAAGALSQTLAALERAGLLPTWLDSDPTNDD